jgi:DNA-binding transcriptional LysR family regulator
MGRLTNRLQIKDYRLVLAIHETGQLALAAEQLAMTQPAASRMLAAIERVVGAKAFIRHPRGMSPTPVGEVLARNAANLLRGLEETEREVRAVGAGLAGNARVGAVTGGAVGFVVPAIQELKRIARGADIHIDVAPSDVLVDGLIRGDYDFVLSRIPAGTDPRDFCIHRGRAEIICFLVRKHHPLAGGKNLKASDLDGYEWVIQAPHTPMRQAVEETFIANGIPLPSEIVNTTSLVVMMAYLDSTNAIAPVSCEVAELFAPNAAAGDLVALNLEEPIIINPYHVISLRSRIMSPLATQLHGLVINALAPQDE